jgi:hypothetical protein
MAKAIIESLEGIAEALKTEYVKIEAGHPLAAKHLGKFALKVDAVDGVALEDVQGLKNSLSASRQERDEWKKKVLALGDDFDPEVAKAAMAKVKEMENWKPDDKVREQIESAKKQLADKHGKEVGDLKTSLTQREREIEQLLIDAEATRAITEMKGSVKLLLPAIKGACKVVRDADGKLAVQVLQPDGKNPRLSAKAGSTENMTIAEFVESLKSDESYAPAFSGTGARGTGATGGQPQNKQSTQSNSGNTGGAGGQGGSIDYVSALKEQRRAEAGTR